VHDLFAWIEASAPGRIIRDMGPWTYAVVNLLHILGIASLFGAILVMDLRLLGVFRRVQLRPIADVAVPVARAGFALAAASGIGLLATNATEYDGNPFILIKFPAIAIGLANALALARSAAWKAARDGVPTADQTRRLGVMGGVSLASWLTAVTAGRMIGYW
jgi:hypothetical protein